MKRVALLSLLLLSVPAFADEKPVATQDVPSLVPQRKAKTTNVIKLNYVSPTTMLQWLDPKNNPTPADDCLGPQMPASLKTSPNAFHLFEMPEGITSMVAIEAQRAILVRGTKEGVEELQRILELVDKPLKPVEIDVALYETDNPTIQQMVAQDKVGDKMANLQNPASLIFIQDNKTILDKSLVDGRTRLLKSEKLQTFSNQSVCSETKFPLKSLPEKCDFRIALVPTVNGDDTITVLIVPSFQTSKVEGERVIQTVQTVAILRNRDTIALANNSVEKNSFKWICLITPRLVKENPDAAVPK